MRVVPNLEELSTLAGQEVAVGDWFEIDQARINGFAEATNGAGPFGEDSRTYSD